MGLIGRSECSSGLRQSVGQVGVLGYLNSDGVSSSFDGIARLMSGWCVEYQVGIPVDPSSRPSPWLA